MLDKFKRYRVRQKEGRIGVKLDVKVYLRRATGLPVSAANVSAYLVKGRRSTAFQGGDVRKGELASSFSHIIAWGAAACSHLVNSVD